MDLSRPEQVGSALLEYLAGRLGVNGLRFAEEPEALGRGLDTYIYSFRLEGNGLDPAWAHRLVLRLYPTADQDEKAEREAAVQRFAAERGYPALSPLAWERQAGPFGRPVMVMERVAGAPMLERMGVNPLRIARLFRTMAEAHVALHRLPLDGCPLPSDPPLVERRLAEFRERVRRAELGELRAGLRWLEERKGAVIPEEPSLCHNDFHPLNVMVGEDGGLTVLDWSDASVGDRLHDVARTLAVFRFAWIAGESRIERLLLRLSRGFLASRYLGPYRKLWPIDRERLHYWEALQAFHGWLQLAELEAPTKAPAGARPEALARVPAGLLALVRDYFWQVASG